MSDIPTWHERAMRHPDHQTGMVSEDMLRARMCEEIADLRAEIERLRRIKAMLDRNEREFIAAIGLVTTTLLGPKHDFSNPIPSMKRVLDEVEKRTRERDAALAEVERLREAMSWYADQRNHFPVEHRRPGDPDPAVVFLEESPIMSDGGKRARKALWGKP